MKPKKLKKHLLDLGADLFGSLALDIGLVCFAEAAQIAPGGVSGVALMIKHLAGFPVGLMTFLINLPLLIIALRRIGGGFVLRSLRTLVISSAMLDLIVSPFFPRYAGDRMLGSLFGGVFMGLGLGLIFLRGSSTAGTDIISLLVEQKHPHIQLGAALMAIDCAVLAASVFVFGSIESVLFGVVALFCQTQVLNAIVYGSERGQLLLIISNQSRKIAAGIIAEMNRGATLIHAEGAYSGEERPMLMCVTRAREYYHLRQIVRREDPAAFVVVTSAARIFGEGFKQE
ncbi:MAG: YitT family protein [Oscillospiraceae bacterium]|nr:YitT family protein [Oscillospiraceae bacterium]